MKDYFGITKQFKTNKSNQAKPNIITQVES